MSPSPSTAVPSLTMATVFLRMVYSNDSSGRSWMAMHTRATPGVYAMDRSSRSRVGASGNTSILPPSCMRNVRSYASSTTTPGTAFATSITFCAWASSRQCTTTSSSTTGPLASNPLTAAMLPPT